QISEVLERLTHGFPAYIVALHDLGKTHSTQGRRHGAGVVTWIGESAGMHVVGIADDERDTLRRRNVRCGLAARDDPLGRCQPSDALARNLFALSVGTVGSRQFQNIAIVSNCKISVVAFFIREPAIEIDNRRFRIDFNRLVEVGNGFLVFSHAGIDEAAVVVAPYELWIKFQGLGVIGDSPSAIAFPGVGRPTIVVGVGELGIEFDAWAVFNATA